MALREASSGRVRGHLILSHLPMRLAAVLKRENRCCFSLRSESLYWMFKSIAMYSALRGNIQEGKGSDVDPSQGVLNNEVENKDRTDLSCELVTKVLPRTSGSVVRSAQQLEPSPFPPPLPM